MISERILQKNLRVLAKENPVLAVAVERADIPDSWYIYEARNGMPTLEIEYQGRRQSVHSRYNPQKEAVSWVQSLPEDCEVLIVFGFGLGYHYEEIVSLPCKCEVIVVETDFGNLKAALSCRDFTAVIRRGGLRVVCCSDPMGSSKQATLKHLGKNIVVKGLPAYENIFKDFWRQMQANIKDLVRQHRVNMATVEHLKQQWLENYVENALQHFQSTPVRSLFNRFEGRPVIIVAAGPSLDKNVHLLNDLRHKALIIAAGSAVKVLEKHKIVPHLVVSFDGSEANYRHFAHLEIQDVPLVFAPMIYPQILREYKGPKFTAELDTLPFIRWIDLRIGWDAGMLISGPSVANLCCDLAIKMGANPIILIGQDLAFSNLRTHANGAAHQQIIDVKQKEYIMVEDIFGRQVPTTAGFYSMKVWFEQYFSLLAKDQLIVDASEGGVRIEGTKICTLQEAIVAYLQEEFRPESIVQEAMLGYSPTETMERMHKLRAVLDELMEQRRLIQRCYGESISYGEQLSTKAGQGGIKKDDYTKAVKMFRRLYSLTTKLDFFQVFLKEGTAPRLRAFNLVLGKSLREEHNLTKKIYKLIRLYQAFFREIDEFAGIVDNCLRQLKHLLLEAK